ncbi:RraA family protein [Arsenicitalea aurantiaca]|uniref:Putative 4-hydroxy-4-methyl-2-oxoglutarate aldolase n=1 Tax=Arsenicitalea aurantiaca TaxID=1783274 RepID=A0A433X2J3_9HYPH|nr:RraA family protein [Arsenicitalea aurantiaca]RUT28303.1 RraA family protein [Arsenicitalea aurantiaca]
MPIGFRLFPRQGSIAPELVAQFRDIPVANVSDSMSRMSAAGPQIRKMHRSGVLIGPALTVKSRPGDNLMLHKALDMAAPGDVIVMDAGGDLTNALFGELMLAHALNRKIAGFVLNGAIRDADAIYETNLPVYAAGVTHRGPYKDGPGEINVPIAICGMVVKPGDLILGDSDGVVAIPANDAEDILVKARAKQRSEAQQMEAIKAQTNDRTWVDASLHRLGCDFHGQN